MVHQWGGGFIKTVPVLETSNVLLVAFIEQNEETLSFVGTTQALLPACFLFCDQQDSSFQLLDSSDFFMKMRSKELHCIPWSRALHPRDTAFSGAEHYIPWGTASPGAGHCSEEVGRHWKDVYAHPKPEISGARCGQSLQICMNLGFHSIQKLSQ